MADLATLTTPTRIDERRFALDAPAGWQQGKALFGGLVVGSLVRAAEAFVGDATRPLRSLTAHLCGPVQPGPIEIDCETLRTGNNTVVVQARILQGGALQSHAVALFGRDRPTLLDGVELERPEMPDWRPLEPAPVRPPLAPEFSANLEFRVVEGAPFSGSDRSFTCGWVRALKPAPRLDTAALASHIDAWWPALYARLEEPRPISTTTFTFEPVGSTEGLDPTAPLFHVGRTIAATHGYTVELRELWGEDGRLVALNQQTIAIVR